VSLPPRAVFWVILILCTAAAAAYRIVLRGDE